MVCQLRAGGAGGARRVRVRERDLQGHFTHEQADPDAEPTETPEAAPEDADVQLKRGVEVLKSWTYFHELRPTGPVSADASQSGDAASTATAE